MYEKVINQIHQVMKPKYRKMDINHVINEIFEQYHQMDNIYDKKKVTIEILKRLYHIHEIEPHYKQIDWKIDAIERNKTQRESYYGNCCIS